MTVAGEDGPEISLIVPVFNEEGTLGLLAERVAVVARAELGGRPLEVVLVDDGSTDGSWAAMRALARARPELRCFRLRRNFGKATALALGAEMARGRILITLDADLQDDPADIPRFLARLDEGFDLVSGWKIDRQDPLSKTVPSRFFNYMTRRLSGVQLHDFNSGFKAARREVYRDISLYGELHRYIPLLAHGLGYRVSEIPVTHHARAHGRSKYGLERYARGFLDLLTVLTITRFGQRPGHLFGGLGIVAGLIGLAILLYLTILWLGGQTIGERPLLLLGVMISIMSAQLLTLGLLAELVLHRTQAGSVRMLLAEATAPPTPAPPAPAR